MMERQRTVSLNGVAIRTLFLVTQPDYSRFNITTTTKLMRPESVNSWEGLNRLCSYELYIPQGNNTLPLLQEGCFHVTARCVSRYHVNRKRVKCKKSVCHTTIISIALERVKAKPR